MITKNTLYPKTERMSENGDCVKVTEKLDGSNLVFYKKNNELYIGLRKNVFSLTDIEEAKDLMYKDLYKWLQEYGEDLKNALCDNSAICGEWIGMGATKYPEGTFDKKWYMFAKANISNDEKLINIKHDHELFIYSFQEQKFPNYLGIVPEVTQIREMPTKTLLDVIYEEYTKKVERPVEGFVMDYRGIITKYVRMKKGHVVEYSQDDHKGE